MMSPGFSVGLLVFLAVVFDFDTLCLCAAVVLVLHIQSGHTALVSVAIGIGACAAANKIRAALTARYVPGLAGRPVRTIGYASCSTDGDQPVPYKLWFPAAARSGRARPPLAHFSYVFDEAELAWRAFGGQAGESLPWICIGQLLVRMAQSLCPGVYASSAVCTGSLGDLRPDRAPAAAGDDGGYPLVLFAHGRGGFPFIAAELCEKLAGLGFVVAAPAFGGEERSGAAGSGAVPFSRRRFVVVVVLGGLEVLGERAPGD